VKRRSAEVWSGKSYVDGITVPPTPFPPRLTVPTRINHTWVPIPTTPKSPKSQKTNTLGRSSSGMKRPVRPALPTSAGTGAVVFPSPKQECPSVEANIGPGSRHQRRKRFSLDVEDKDSDLPGDQIPGEQLQEESGRHLERGL